MTEEKKVNLSCDDIAVLISRNIDGDLNRSETIQLHEHIATCAQCRIQMSELSALGSSMDDLRTLYQTHSPSPNFGRSVHDAISKNKKYYKVSNQTTSLFQRLRRGHFFSGIVKPKFGVLGTLAVLSLGMLLWWQGAFQQTPSLERLIVHEIPLHSAEDKVSWNQQHTVLPSQTVRLNIQQSHSDPYFFRVSSSNSVGFSITHNQKIQNINDFKRLHLNGIQYITLKNPRLHDFVNIHNHGPQPISLRTFSYSPHAIQASFTSK